jgi:hypothetical protein
MQPLVVHRDAEMGEQLVPRVKKRAAFSAQWRAAARPDDRGAPPESIIRND